MEQNLKNLVFVFLGGGLGSVARYLISIKLDQNIPLGTFLVNILGCLLIGFIGGLFEKELINNPTRILWAVGFCGGFTTFSTLILQKYQMALKGDYLQLLLYASLSIFIGLISIVLGIKISKLF